MWFCVSHESVSAAWLHETRKAPDLKMLIPIALLEHKMKAHFLVKVNATRTHVVWFCKISSSWLCLHRSGWGVVCYAMWSNWFNGFSAELGHLSSPV